MATSTVNISALRLIKIIPMTPAAIINDNCDARVTVIIIATDIAANAPIRKGVEVIIETARETVGRGGSLASPGVTRRFRTAAAMRPNNSDIINCNTSA